MNVCLARAWPDKLSRIVAPVLTDCTDYLSTHCGIAYGIQYVYCMYESKLEIYPSRTRVTCCFVSRTQISLRIINCFFFLFQNNSYIFSLKSHTIQKANICNQSFYEKFIIKYYDYWRFQKREFLKIPSWKKIYR